MTVTVQAQATAAAVSLTMTAVAVGAGELLPTPAPLPTEAGSETNWLVMAGILLILLGGGYALIGRWRGNSRG
jgi:LPXTG-motif cell wall-anchored protein